MPAKELPIIRAEESPRIVASRKTTAVALDCSDDHVDELIDKGLLEKVQLGQRKVGVTWRSIYALVEGSATR